MTHHPSPIPVVIDTDIGADPDDALALVLALASPEVDVRGVTIVSGDVDLRARMAARLLGMAGRQEIPVFRGQGVPLDPTRDPAMTGTEGQGLLDLPYEGPEATIDETFAPDWLAEESRRRPFHLVAIGPLTNVALALGQDPGLAGRLLGLTAMGGLLDARSMPVAWQRDIRERGPAAWPDYNTVSDPTAALAVARSMNTITWVTLDVTMRAPLRAMARDALLPNTPLGAALGRMIDAWRAFWFPTALPSPDDPSPVPADAVALLHDPLALAALFPGEWLHLRPARLAYGIEDGVFRLHEQPDGASGRLAAEVDGARFEAFFVARIMRQIAQLSVSAPL
ncbi:MAG: nucleoside hydrolase [Chloroflexi bacterium]|nr:nucleoside hydrolase [Chloroflexota bacterium]